MAEQASPMEDPVFRPSENEQKARRWSVARDHVESLYRRQREAEARREAINRDIDHINRAIGRAEEKEQAGRRELQGQLQHREPPRHENGHQYGEAVAEALGVTGLEKKQ